MSIQPVSISTAIVSRVNAVSMVAVAMILSLNLGCQSFPPFAKKTRQNFVSARQWASSGLEAMHNGRLEKAKGLFSRATQQNPNDATVRENFARTLHQNGDTQQAIAQMQRAVELSRGDTRLTVELGELYLEAGQWLAARRQAELALANDHRFAPAWGLRGKTEKLKGNYQQALADFQRALGLSSDLPEVEMEIVDTYLKMSQPLRALSAVEQLLGKHPFDNQPEPAVLAKGIALMRLNQPLPAIDILQTAIEKQTVSAEMFVRLGQAQLLAGQVSQARMTLNQGKQTFPNMVVFDALTKDLQSAETRVASTDLMAR